MAADSLNVYQFKISLKYTSPKIWRQILVPEEYNFYDLHVAIQDVMGWKNYDFHLFEVVDFEFGHKTYIGSEDFEFVISSKAVELSRYFVVPKIKAKYYTYDFDDGWLQIVLEKILPRIEGVEYPQCIAGQSTYPPVECSDVNKYEEFLENILNHQHKNYEEQMEWLEWNVGGSFDINNFDPMSVKFNHIHKH